MMKSFRFLRYNYHRRLIFVIMASMVVERFGVVGASFSNNNYSLLSSLLSPPTTPINDTSQRVVRRQQQKQQQQQQQQQHLERNLQQARIFFYIPSSEVTDLANIDWDQRDIETELSELPVSSNTSEFETLLQTDYLTDFGLMNAYDVYASGGHSKCYAYITLRSALSTDVTKGDQIIGYNGDGEQITGGLRILQNNNEHENDENVVVLPAGSTVVEIQYDNDNWDQLCEVGASRNPIYTGCFAAEGNITLGNNEPIEYTYDIVSDNRNGRSMRRFSTEPDKGMTYCYNRTPTASTMNNCPYQYPDFVKFYDYYGTYNYADQWIEAVYRQNSAHTNFPSRRGDADFSLLHDENNNNNNETNDDVLLGRAEAIKISPVSMNVWMYVILKMENAIDGCFSLCGENTTAPDDPAAAVNPCDNMGFRRLWDEAVALYTGSIDFHHMPVEIPPLPPPVTAAGGGGGDGNAANTTDAENNTTTTIAATTSTTKNADENDNDGDGNNDNHQGGHLLFDWANHHCKTFRTCSDHIRPGTEDSHFSYWDNHNSDIATINFDVFEEFMTGQLGLSSGYCRDVLVSKEKIVSAMAIPIIQSTLQYAYKIHVEGDLTATTEIMGATYAASILPMVHHCSSSDAETIYRHMHIQGNYINNNDNNGSTENFRQVKQAFENNYACLRISCDRVGGLVADVDDVNSNYMQYAEPCNNDDSDSDAVSSSSSSSNSVPQQEQQVPPPQPEPQEEAQQDASPETTTNAATTNSSSSSSSGNNSDENNRNPEDDGDNGTPPASSPAAASGSLSESAILQTTAAQNRRLVISLSVVGVVVLVLVVALVCIVRKMRNYQYKLNHWEKANLQAASAGENDEAENDKFMNDCI